MRRSSRLVVLTCCFLVCQVIPGAPPKNIAPHETLRFYRVLIPADNNAQLAQPGYFPIPRKRFAEYISALQSNTSGRTLQARITAARYTAQYQNGTLVGQASLNVRKLKPQGFAVLDLAMCGFWSNIALCSSAVNSRFSSFWASSEAGAAT